MSNQHVSTSASGALHSLRTQERFDYGPEVCPKCQKRPSTDVKETHYRGKEAYNDLSYLRCA
jgi:hypothetical protein